MAIPGLVFILLDNRSWDPDGYNYATRAIILSQTLLESPRAWLKLIAEIFQIKAPMIIWIGQFFVYLGLILGSIQKGLLLSIIIFLYLSLLVFYKAIYSYTNNKIIGVSICLFIASTSLFIDLSTSYYVEILQLFSVIWVLNIVLNIKRYTLPQIFYHSTLAFFFSVAVKVSSPLYIFFPFIYIIYLSFRHHKDYKIKDFYKRENFLLLTITLLFILLVSIWYINSYDSIIRFLKYASTCPFYGRDLPLFYKFIQWVEILYFSLFDHWKSIFFIISISLVFYKIIINKCLKICPIVLLSISQLSIILIVFSLFINESNRFLLATFPYICILLSKSFSLVKSKFIHYSILLFSIVAFASSQLTKLKTIIPSNPYKYHKEEIINNLCFQNSEIKKIFIGEITLSSFNDSEMHYRLIEQKHIFKKDIKCAFYGTYFFYEGQEYFDAKKIWNDYIIKEHPEFNFDYIIAISTSDQIDTRYMSQFQKLATAIYYEVRKSPYYTKLPPDKFPDLEIYKRTR